MQECLFIPINIWNKLQSILIRYDPLGQEKGYAENSTMGVLKKCLDLMLSTFDILTFIHEMFLTTLLKMIWLEVKNVSSI